MPRIYELDPHVADLIAAGEVVERPASVVKELMENSIDAGAGIITVEVVAGGMTYIRVTDNGCGIAPDDAKTAFLRHATSKLRGAEGLEAIGTLGFRGEALAAIAAVSRIELLTREPGASEGVSLSLEAGEVRSIKPAGCPEGTTIIVRDLFFNTPARLKFVKSDRAESSAIASAVLRTALSHPEVSLRFIRDGKTETHTPGDSRVDSCIYSLFGREFSAGMIKADSSDEAVAVSGYVSKPEAARGNRSYQFFFVNNRPIRSVTLQAALEQAYANTLPGGRFPSCVLYLKTSFSSVDVNVHPAKTEVKFISDKQIFDGVYYAALGALQGARETRIQGTGNREQGSGQESGVRDQGTGIRDQESGIRGQSVGGRGFKSMDADEFRKKYGSGDTKAGKKMTGYTPDSKLPDINSQLPFQVNEYQRGYNSDTTKTYSTKEANLNLSQLSINEAKHPVPAASFNESGNRGPSTPNSEFIIPNSEFRVIGEALGTYIIVEYRESMWLIDKHAAHERMHFNALRSGEYEPMSQALIVPVVCRHGHEGAALLLESSDLLDRLGFTVESLGDDAVAVRRIPAEIEISDVEPALSEICAQLGRGGKVEPTQQDSIYRTIACKAAIKAGKSSEKRELEALTLRVLSGELAQCPHGRPVAFEITKATLDKGFKRT